MSEQSRLWWKSYVTRGYILVALCILALLCVIGVSFLPHLKALFFIFIVGLLVCAVFVYQSELPAEIIKSKVSTEYMDLKGRDALICQSMTSALLHPAYVIDQRAIVRYSNKTARNTFGSLRNGNWLFLKFRQRELRQTIEEGLTTRQPMKTDYNEPVPDNRWFSVEVSPIPRFSEKDPSDKKLFLVSFHDLTEVKRIDQMRSDFIANASHELRTPLASLLGYLETMKGPAKNDKAAISRFTDVMLDQAQRMTRLVNDLLSLSRIEMQSHVRPSEVVDLTDVLNGIVVSLEGVATQFGVEIEFNASEGAEVIGERDELIQVFENLVENACKYGQDGGKVIVSLEIDKECEEPLAIVRVQDFGPGIAMEHQQRITERFYRVDVETSREKQGTGLGLAIVKHILNRHGTRLNIVSELGEGAVFSVDFPIHNMNK